MDYECKDDIFTWTTDFPEDNYSKMPIIYLCSPENITFFESESLHANDFDGYIKFENQDIANSYY